MFEKLLHFDLEQNRLKQHDQGKHSEEEEEGKGSSVQE